MAVVRISGPESFPLVEKIFVRRTGSPGPLPPRAAVLGTLRDSGGANGLDRAVVTCFPAPNSYTGQDVAEISLHGSPVLVSSLLESLCSLGTRLAEPGEFTLRAFLNGRMDLTQAEAVRDVIEARTLYQAQVAGRQHRGELSKRLEQVKRQLMEVIIPLESAVEFVEEDLPLESRAALAARLEGAREELSRWIASYRKGRLIRDGFSLAIVGRPNVGKSSLFNALLARNRSIVAEVPGTTRDLVSEDTNIEGIPVRLLDTAGLRPTEDRLERMGVELSLQAISDAEAILLVVDGSQPMSAEDDELKSRLEDLPYLVVLNKSDLVGRWTESDRMNYAGSRPLVTVSAKTGERVEELRRAIFSRLFGGDAPERESLLVTNLRHCRCLESAQSSLGRAGEALRSGLSEEFALVDLHTGLRHLGEITGEVTVEDLLGEIFSRFCVGK